MNSTPISRRKLLSAVGIGLIAPRLAFGGDEQAGSPITNSGNGKELAENSVVFQHWTPEENAAWQWYRLERFKDGHFKTAGISLPMQKASGIPFTPADGYLSVDDIPAYVLDGELPELSDEMIEMRAKSQFDLETALSRTPDPEIKSREGRPPSEWLRSLFADELRIWLPLVDASEAGVNGMTFWVHLIRDHGFDSRRIEGLLEWEFAKLHALAHEGY